MIFPQQARAVTPVFAPDSEYTLEKALYALKDLINRLPKKETLPKHVVEKVISLEDMIGNLRRAQELSKGVDDRLKKFEPINVKVDGVEFLAEPAETKAYEEALSIFRSGDFAAASNAFNDFVNRNPKSGYVLPSMFWLGNAQYANRDYKNAIRNFSTLMTRAPNHTRAPEAMLSVGNCQLELKDIKAARKTFADLLKTYPHTEAASAANERLAKLK